MKRPVAPWKVLVLIAIGACLLTAALAWAGAAPKKPSLPSAAAEIISAAADLKADDPIPTMPPFPAASSQTRPLQSDLIPIAENGGLTPTGSVPAPIEEPRRQPERWEIPAALPSVPPGSSARDYSSSVRSSGGPVHVSGYTRANGTYVRPYTRSR
jgi:hypothetical protein